MSFGLQEFESERNSLDREYGEGGGCMRGRWILVGLVAVLFGGVALLGFIVSGWVCFVRAPI